MKPFKLGVTGTRYGISQEQFLAAQAWLQKPFWNRDFELVEFHQGDCVGADAQLSFMVRMAHPKCKIIGHIPEKSDLREYFENDEEREPTNYLARNRNIVNEVDMLIAFPAHKDMSKGGTWYTIKYAKKQGKKVGIFHFDGTREMS